MILLYWYGGSKRAVQRFGINLQFAVGHCFGQWVFGYTSNPWCLDFMLDDPPLNEIWFFDNSIPVFTCGD